MNLLTQVNISMSVQGSPLTTADGTLLKVSLRKAERAHKIKSFLFIVPTLIFILFAFLIPIADMLIRSAYVPEVAELLPKSIRALDDWDGTGLPDESTYQVLAQEMAVLKKQRTLGKISLLMNYEKSGMRSLIQKTGRKVARIKEGPYKEKMIEIDKRWTDREVWAVIQRTGQRFTFSYYLSAFDLKYDVDGNVIAQPEAQQVHTTMWIRTIWVSLAVTILCLLLGYPVSYFLSTLPVRISNLLLICVLLPFWTSLLVRLTSWIVLLQKQGVLNDVLVWLGIIADEQRVRMVYNMSGTLVAMSHILLPFMILPLYSVMKTIAPMAAARPQLRVLLMCSAIKFPIS